MQTTLSGIMDEAMAEEITKAAQRFYGKVVRVTIEKPTESKSRGRKNGPPNSHRRKHAPSRARNLRERR